MKTFCLTLTLMLGLLADMEAQIKAENIDLSFNYGTTAYNGGTSMGISSGVDFMLTEKLLLSPGIGFSIGSKRHEATFGYLVNNEFQNFNVDYKAFEEKSAFLDLKLMRKLLPASMKSELNAGGGITLSYLSVEYGPLVTYSVEQMDINRDLVSNDDFLFLFNLTLDYKYKISNKWQIIAGGIFRISLFQNPEISITQEFVGTAEVNPSVIGMGDFKIGLGYILK